VNVYAGDGSPMNASLNITRSTSPISVRTLDTDSPFGSITVSFWARSEDRATLVARVVSAIDGANLGSAVVMPTQDWAQIVLTVPFGRNARLEIVGLGQFDIDQPQLEAGAALLPFFNGYTEPSFFGDPDLYRVTWLGIAGTSASRVRWVGVAQTERCGTDWRPFVLVSQGSIAATTLTLDYGLAVSAEEQAERYERNLHDVVTISGPKILQEYKLDVGAMVLVEFGFNATSPSPYGPTHELFVRQKMSDLPTTPWVDVAYPEVLPSVIQDPACAVLPPAPRPPTIPNVCLANPPVWQRYWLDIPADEVSAWSQTVPTVTLNSGPTALRQVRVRFYPNPFGYSTQADGDVVTIRRNLAQNPGVETGLTNWTMLTAGLGSLTRVATGRTSGSWAAQYLRTSAVSTSPVVVRPGGGAAGLAVGDLATLAIDVTCPTLVGADGLPVVLNLEARIETSGAVTSWQYMPGAESVMADGTVQRILLQTEVPPLDAGQTAITGVMLVIDAPNLPNGAAFFLDSATIEEGHTSGDFFSGATPDSASVDYTWEGVANNSVSRQTIISNAAPIDPNSFCSEFILSYLPAQTELTIDGTVERAFASVAGAPSNTASHLLYGTDGVPMTWPEMSCGIPYAVTIDVPPAEAANVSVSLALTRRE
jgi:hypothetical protein